MSLFNILFNSFQVLGVKLRLFINFSSRDKKRELGNSDILGLHICYDVRQGSKNQPIVP